jgi:hypothetical protein
MHERYVVLVTKRLPMSVRLSSTVTYSASVAGVEVTAIDQQHSKCSPGWVAMQP